MLTPSQQLPPQSEDTMATAPIQSIGITPGPWSVGEDPMGEQGYKTLVELPSRSGGYGTWIAVVQHNWNEAGAGERRISWKEAEANARVMAVAPELLDALYQYRSDLRHPPAPDSIERRLAMIEKLIAKTEGR